MSPFLCRVVKSILTPVAISGLASELIPTSAHGAATVKWKGGDGRWEDASHWGEALPGVMQTAEIDSGRVSLHEGVASVLRLDVAQSSNAEATVTLDGGTLNATEFVRLGELGNSRGRLVINGGRLCTTEIGVGGMNGGATKGTPCDAEMEVRGGTVVTKYLMVGWRTGSTARVRVVGSKAAGFVALNSMEFAITDEKVGSTCELTFEIDAEGVTPLELRNPHDSIRIARKDSPTKCLLHVKLLAAPPGGDIPLLRSFRPCIGTFHELPEGALVRADYDGKTFEWRLTYHGGESKCDIVLTDPHIMVAEARLPYRSPRSARNLTVDPAAVQAAWEGLFREIDRHTPPLETGTLAFPGAEGYGAYAQGGRGGKALFVTNLHDAGPGSLRAAIEAKGPRTVIFRVGGIIALQKALQIHEPFITIAGQTAPGDGICLKGAQDTLTLINTHDVIVRYLRVRTGFTGDKDENQGDSISCYNAQNFVIDHCSTSWGTDETLSCTLNCDRYTVQWSIIAEGLDYYGHSMGSILGGDRSTWHHNLYVSCGTRNPRFAGLCRCDFRNNVIYDWRDAAGYGDFRSVNFVNNFLKPGPSTRQKPPRFINGDSYVLPGSLFARGNVMDGSPAFSEDNRLGSGFGPAVFATADHPAPPVETQPAQAARDLVLAQAGATWPKRDAVDLRLVEEMRAGTGQVIKYERDVGGWPTYAGAEPPVDSDEDGIPDEWEKAHGLDPLNPGDANKMGEDGYTNLERYLNSLPGK
jgi:hypothetical protein